MTDGEMFDGFEEALHETEIDSDTSLSESTMELRQRELRAFSEWLRERGIDSVKEVDERTILKYVKWCGKQGYAKNTITNTKFGPISVAYNSLYNARIIDDNPVDRLSVGQISDIAESYHPDEKENLTREDPVKDHLSKEEVYQMAENSPVYPDRDEALIKLLFWTGIRVSELIGIEIGEDGTLDGPESDIDPKERSIDVNRPKADDELSVFYPEELNPLLRDYVSHGRLRFKKATETRKLFVGPKGALTKSGVERVVDKAAREVDLQEERGGAADGRTYHRVTPHILRHSLGMYLFNEEGERMGVVSDVLGHSKQEITEQFYAGTDRDYIKGIYDNVGD